MINRHFLFQCIFPCLIAFSNHTHAASITWVAQSPNNDINDPANWNPNTVPGSNDDAIFNSTISRIATNPTENSLPFSVSTFNFSHKASIFDFNFNNKTLTFNGVGITGANTNSTITVTNTNNSSFPGDLVSFLGVSGTSGSAGITSSNSATLTGSHSGTGIGAINSNIHSSGDFTIANGGGLTASNTGNDNANGTGNNGSANTSASQLRFDQSFTAGDNVAVVVQNSGTFSGTNTVQGDAVAIVNGSQFISSGAFQVGDNFSCQVQNTGNDSSSGVGLSNIGQLNAAQMFLQTTGTAGDNCTFTVSNTGINSSQTTNFPDFVGYLNDQQFFVGSTFQAGGNFSLSVSNTGTDTSTGHGASQVAVINSNSGTTGNQILLQQGCLLGDDATISATNSGTYSGTNTSGGCNIGGMNLQQIAIGDSTAPGSHTFIAGDHFSLSASNMGNDSSNGLGSDAVGDVSTDQITFFTPSVLGNNANITITNSGTFSGNASATYVNVGSTGHSQLNCASTFSVDDHFTLNVSNSGTNTGTGIGGYFIGDVITGQQVEFQNDLLIGDNASITISNMASNSSNTTNNNQVGSLMGYGKQLFAEGQFQSGDNLVLEITNSGFDDSIGSGGNFVGFINNNTVDNSASQLHLNAGALVGNHGSITISNTGTYEGSNTTTGNLIGVLSGQQFNSVSDFHAENDFRLSVSNSGVNDASGQSNNRIGTIGSSQVLCGGACVIGNNASIVLLNSGSNNDTAGTSNNVGVINGCQMKVSGNFNAGTALNINASNMSINAGDSSNFVGHVSDSQLFFAQRCTLNDKSSIGAFNFGTVTNSQIVFDQGFDVASGKVIIQVVNEGTVGSFGIDVQGNNAGGNALIQLGNSSLNIGTTLSTFTIAGLEGDNTSFVQSQPQLIINTDAVTQAEFSGVIQDFPATSSTLMKTGAGTQILSGVNTYTGLTTINEGALVVNGSLTGDVLTTPFGTLKGNGTIGGTFTNTGVVAPGESIGTLTMNNYINNNGTYAVEVNGLGQSDLIDVSEVATLNGGTVIVSSSDGYRFQQPYTIVTAGADLVGTYTDATSLAFITPTLSYDPHNVYLTIRSDLINAAEKCNQFGVATNLDNIVNPNTSQTLLLSALVNLPLAKAQEGLESLSGFQYTNDVLVTKISTSRLLRRLYDPLRSLVTACDPCSISCSEWATWLETDYSFTNLHGSKAHKLHFDSYQVTGGIQKTFCHNLTFGLAGSYEYDNVKYHNGKANRNSEFGCAYGLYRPSMFYGLFDFVYGHSSNKLKRTIRAGNLEYKAHSKPSLNIFTFYGEAGFDLDYECLLIQPFAGIQIGKNWREHIKENQDNGWGLTINKHRWTLTSSRLGLHISTCNLCDCIDASLDVAWNHLLSSRKNRTVGRFTEFGDAFRICGNRLDDYSFDYALTFTTCLCEGLTGYFELSGESWPHANTFDVLGGVKFSW